MLWLVRLCLSKTALDRWRDTYDEVSSFCEEIASTDVCSSHPEMPRALPLDGLRKRRQEFRSSHRAEDLTMASMEEYSTKSPILSHIRLGRILEARRHTIHGPTLITWQPTR